jgi:hypothetical protein
VMDRGRSNFERFVAEVEPRTRRVPIAGFGAVVGCESAADALASAWQKLAELTPGVASSDDLFEPRFARRLRAGRRLSGVCPRVGGRDK